MTGDGSSHHCHSPSITSAVPYFPITSTSSTSSSTSKSKPKTARMNIRLDSDLEDGITFSPDELASHNRKKRLFLPFLPVYDDQALASSGKDSKEESVHKPSFVLNQDDEEDEEKEERENVDKLAQLNLNLNPDSARLTDAASYKASIDMTANLNPENRIDMTSYGGGKESNHSYEPSISAATNRSTSSRLSTMTASSLYLSAMANSKNGSKSSSSSKESSSVPKEVLERVNTTSFKIPPSIAGSGTQSQQPWNTTSRSIHNNFERSNVERRRINENGGDAGDLLPEVDEEAWRRINSDGIVPGKLDLEAKKIEDEGGLSIADDGKSIFTTETFLNESNKTIRGGKERDPNQPLLVNDIFTTTPFPLPSRLIRRINPRQCLLIIAGVSLSAAELQTRLEARSQAQKLLEMKLSPVEMKVKLNEMREEKKNQKSWLNKFGGNDSEGDQRAGLGVFFSPVRDQDLEADKQRQLEIDAGSKDDGKIKRAENMSRRLERPNGFNKTTQNRATLRAALAALEYIKWEEEGRDQIVVGTDERWLVEGISEDIFLWRTNGWKLTKSSPLGDFGDQVPDRDLWETLDHVIRGYEKIDCNCRFWLLPRSETKAARKLAEEGAMKDNQQPATVRWTRPSENSATDDPNSNSNNSRSSLADSAPNKDTSDAASLFATGSGPSQSTRAGSQKTASQVAMEKMMRERR